MPSSVIKSARRVFEVLEYFDDVRRPASLHDIVSHFGYPLSSGYSLLKSIVAMGYLDYDKASRTYMPTMRVATLGHWVQDALFGDNRILPFMQHLSAVTGEMVCLGTQSDLLAQYIYVISSSRPLDLRLRSGTVRPLAGSGLGYLLLSAHTDDEIETLLRRINARKRDPSRRIPISGLMEQVNTVRREGYVFSRNIMPGFGLIAMLLPIRHHGRILAIGVGGRVDRLEARRSHILRELHRGLE